MSDSACSRTLGIDVGTSSLKVVLLDELGQFVDEASVSYEVRSPNPGWAEQDADVWWCALRDALAELWARGHSPSTIAGIGLTGQMHSLVLIDNTGTPLCPAILWSDQRTARECDEINERIGVSELLRVVGNQALTGFTAPKMLWVRDHWPDAMRNAAAMLLPKDFIRYRLTGVLATDMSDASGTLLLDVRNRRWAMDLVAELGIDEHLLPRAVEGTTITGDVIGSAAGFLGLVAGTPVVAGGGDNAATAVGLGAVDPGVLTISIGTSGVLFAPLDHYPDRVDGKLHVFCHAVPSRWHVMSVTLAAGGSLHWLRDVLSPLLPVSGDEAYDWLLSRAAYAPSGSDGLVFLPYLTGERTPIVDPHARGVFFGLHMAHRLEHLVRAVAEGVAFSQLQGLDLIREAGAAAEVARGAGGGLQSAVWRQILADVLGIGIQATASATGAARGAALLAGMGLGLYSEGRLGIVWEDQPVTRPDPDPAAALQAGYSTYRALYPSLKPLFAATQLKLSTSNNASHADVEALRTGGGDGHGNRT